MFFQLTENGFTEINNGQIADDILTAGYVTADELISLNGHFGFDESTVAACKGANQSFRSGVEVHSDYTFTELRILNLHEEQDDYVALYLRRNLVLIVDICDADGSTKQKFLSALHRYPAEKVCAEKIFSSFIESLFAGDNTVLEEIENQLSEREDMLQESELDKNFNMDLLRIKKTVAKRYSYYTQLLDIADTVDENDNDICDEDNLIYITNVAKRIARLREDTAILRSSVEHLQDAYSSYLDSKMNKTMNIFTVLTSIFFPLTIIVGWYGMNFESMPEFTWKYGYLYVSVLSVAVVVLLALIGKKKKWF